MNKHLTSSLLAVIFTAGATATASAAMFTLAPLSPAQKTATVHVAATSVCTSPEKSSALRSTPFFEMPEIARLQRASGTSVVQIDLGSNGTLRHAAVVGSSGNAVLDQAAMRTARLSRYSPEVHECRAVSGSYLLSVEFGPDDLAS